MNKFEFLLEAMIDCSEPLNEGWRDVYKQFVETNKIPKDVFKKLKESDPSKTGKYLQWMCKQYVQNPEIDIEEMLNLVDTFNILLNKFMISNKSKDINLLSYDKIKSIVADIGDRRSKTLYRKEIKQHADKIIDNKDMLAIIPLNREAAILYGKGTKWCISSKEENKNGWYSYVVEKKSDWFIFFMLKDGCPVQSKYGNKIAAQMHTEGESKVTFWNTLDETIIEEPVYKLLYPICLNYWKPSQPQEILDNISNYQKAKLNRNKFEMNIWNGFSSLTKEEQEARIEKMKELNKIAQEAKSRI